MSRTSTLRWVLVLGDSGVAVDHRAVESVASMSGLEASTAWLPAVDRSYRPDVGERRRVLVLVDGGRFEVPAAIHMTEITDLLAPPDLLRQSMARVGLIGLAELPFGLTLICDPRRMTRPGALQT